MEAGDVISDAAKSQDGRKMVPRLLSLGPSDRHT